MKSKIIAELIGTMFLAMIVIGSGIMAKNLFPESDGLALLANSIATGAGLLVLIQSIGHISGAHMNPVVSFIEFIWGNLSLKLFIFYSLMQILGGFLGTVVSHLMFDLPLVELSSNDRIGFNLYISEFVATFGLISVIALSGKKHVEFAPLSIALYITSAYWFTSSTSFANPAITFSRMFTNTFTGISPKSYIPFFIAQILGAIVAFFVLKCFSGKKIISQEIYE
jgi:glycerol uptake facilitator-like aquaporin